MRLVNSSAIAVALAMLIPPVIGAQGQDAARAVAGGGISVPGWTGKIDANEEKNRDRSLNNAKLAGDAKTHDASRPVPPSPTGIPRTRPPATTP